MDGRGWDCVALKTICAIRVIRGQSLAASSWRCILQKSQADTIYTVKLRERGGCGRSTGLQPVLRPCTLGAQVPCLTV
jgi:hypothetical protein